jgi:hypothetical protein
MVLQNNFTQPEINQILNQDNLVLRNLQITLGYYRIAQGLRKLIGGDDLNWFCFGCYASKTAGQALRHELVPEHLKSAILNIAGYENSKSFFDSVLKKIQRRGSSAEENLPEIWFESLRL